MLNCYCTGHRWSAMVCKAFAMGASAPIVPAHPLLPGDVFMYGALRGSLPTLMKAQREGRTWFYADNGYLSPGKTEESYFRVTRDALQHDGSGVAPECGAERWSSLNQTIKPWRQGGSHVVVCPPGRLLGATFGFSADEWLSVTMEELRKHTDRELRVRMKVSWNNGSAPTLVYRDGKMSKSTMASLADDLVGAWALVTHSSNAAVESIIAGVPIFATARCGASAMGLSDVGLIEKPRTDGDRVNWSRVIASNQWLLSEMRDGTCWRMLDAVS